MHSVRIGHMMQELKDAGSFFLDWYIGIGYLTSMRPGRAFGGSAYFSTRSLTMDCL